MGAAEIRPEAGRRRRLGWLMVVCGILYAGFLGWRVGAYAGGADTSGYLNLARLLRAGTIETPTRALPEAPARSLPAYAYVPLGFSPAKAGDPTTMVPTYPVGLPLLIAAMSLATGAALAPHVVMVLHALAGVGLVFALARDFGVRRSLAGLAAGMLALSPLYLFVSVQALSDGPALAWTALAVWLARRSRGRARWAVAAGLALGVAALVRPTNARAIVPLAVALGGDRRTWVALAAGVMPAAIGWLWFNHVAYGHPLRTGYGPIWEAFDVAHAGPNVMHALVWLPVTATPAVLAVLALPWAKAIPARDRWLLAGWFAVFAGFYLFYPYTRQAWWGLRFLLPAFPALIVGAALAAETWLARRGTAHWPRVAAGALALWLVGWNGSLRAPDAGRHERVYVEACAWARERLPADAVVLAVQASGAIHHYTDFVQVFWTLVEPADLARIERAAAAGGRPVYAMLFPFEERALLHEKFPGEWRLAGTVRSVRIWERPAR